jgi:hypothetical protein
MEGITFGESILMSRNLLGINFERLICFDR